MIASFVAYKPVLEPMNGFEKLGVPIWTQLGFEPTAFASVVGYAITSERLIEFSTLFYFSFAIKH